MPHFSARTIAVMLAVSSLSILPAAAQSGGAPTPATAGAANTALPGSSAGPRKIFHIPDPYPGWKKVLFIGDIHNGAQVAHDFSVSHAMATIEELGRKNHAFVTILRTDEELLTKQKVCGTGKYAADGSMPFPGRNLNYFDAVVFYTNGELQLTDEQRKALLSFVHDDGKGFVGIHTATATSRDWPEYGKMIGGYFDNHPWGVFNAPVVVEEPDFPAMKAFPKHFRITDEMYEYMAPYSRKDVDVLARLDQSKLDLSNKNVHRKDGDFPVAWAKMYGKGRVFYSDLGHSPATWDNPEVQQMYLQAIRWADGSIDAPVTPHPMPEH